MPVPKRKRSRARRDSRFANKGIKPQSFTHCPNCQDAIMTHQACQGCGHYKGRKVLTTKAERSVKRAIVKNTKAKYAAPAETRSAGDSE